MRTILIVDDEDDIRELVQMSLEMTTDWNVLTASGGAQALDTAMDARPDLVVLDVMMPDMDGPETFRRLQGHDSTSGIPVVFLTAKVQRTEQLDLHALGAAGLIAKPFDPLGLSSQILTVLGATT